MKWILFVCTLALSASNHEAINCDKNPNHRNCVIPEPPKSGIGISVYNGEDTYIGEAYNLLSRETNYGSTATTEAVAVRFFREDTEGKHPYSLTFFP